MYPPAASAAHIRLQGTNQLHLLIYILQLQQQLIFESKAPISSISWQGGNGVWGVVCVCACVWCMLCVVWCVCVW